MLTDSDVVEIREEAEAVVDEGYVTLERLSELTTLEGDVDTSVGRFRVRALSFQQFVETKEQALSDGEPSEWEATKLLLIAGVVRPAIDEDTADEALGAISPKDIEKLVDAITDLSGVTKDEEGTPSFSDG